MHGEGDTRFKRTIQGKRGEIQLTDPGLIKKCIFKCAQFPGIYAVAKKQRRGATALFYHGVEDKIVDPKIQAKMHIPLSQFEKQIKYVQKHFEIISLGFLYECLSNGYKIQPSQVLITFDDGYKNNLTVAAPFLKSHNVPFSVFISTKHIDEGIRFPTYYLRAGIFYT